MRTSAANPVAAASELASLAGAQRDLQVAAVQAEEPDVAAVVKLPRGIAHSIEHNDHKAVYQPIREYLTNNNFDDEDIAPGELEKILATDELWVIRWFPDTPVGHCVAIASTLERALEWANEP